MFIKLLIISIILVAIIMLALGVKLLFNKNAEFASHACAFDADEKDENGACLKCELKDLADCPEEKNNK